MRKIIVYIATSADGFIARKDGAVDWLDRPRTAGDYGMGKFYKSIDTILWGRKTYDLVLRFQKEGKDVPDMSGIKNYAFSRRPPDEVAESREEVRSVPPALADGSIHQLGGECLTHPLTRVVLTPWRDLKNISLLGAQNPCEVEFYRHYAATRLKHQPLGERSSCVSFCSLFRFSS